MPDNALAPVQFPEAAHKLALVDDQASVEEPPPGTVTGLADSDTVGTGGGGGDPVTVTCAVALALFPGLVHVRE